MSILKLQIKIVNILGFFGIRCLSWRQRLANQIIENITKEV